MKTHSYKQPYPIIPEPLPRNCRDVPGHILKTSNRYMVVVVGYETSPFSDNPIIKKITMTLDGNPVEWNNLSKQEKDIVRMDAQVTIDLLERGTPLDDNVEFLGFL